MHEQTIAVLLKIPDTAPFPPPCLHSPDGVSLCEACQDDFECDPQAYVEYGAHRQGLANWTQLQAEMDARPTQPHRPLDIDESEAADDGDVLPW